MTAISRKSVPTSVFHAAGVGLKVYQYVSIVDALNTSWEVPVAAICSVLVGLYIWCNVSLLRVACYLAGVHGFLSIKQQRASS